MVKVECGPQGIVFSPHSTVQCPHSICILVPASCPEAWLNGSGAQAHTTQYTAQVTVADWLSSTVQTALCTLQTVEYNQCTVCTV